jgi:hypothetical protein
MAGVGPTFITGATAKIKLNGKTLAFCSDFSYSIQIAHINPKILGVYEGAAPEPVSYTVSGAFTIVRYAKGLNFSSMPHGMAKNNAGNGVGNWGGVWGNSVGDFLARNGVGNDGRANEALDPSKFAAGTSFDIQVYQGVQSGTSGGGSPGLTGAISSVSNFLRGTQNPSGGTSPNIDYVGVANIRNCRITSANFSISKRSLATQQFTFIAQYLDEDSFVADFSGQGPY